MTRAISVTAWRARRYSVSLSFALFSSSSEILKSRIDFPSFAAADSQAARRSAYPPSTNEWCAWVSIISSSKSLAAKSIGTNLVERSLQSNKSAWPALPISEIDWSIIPQGTPTKSFSAFWVNRARSFTFRFNWNSSFKAVATLHSKAAEEERPAPNGTLPSIKISKPTFTSRAQITPSGYRSHLPSAPGWRFSIWVSKIAVLRCAEAKRILLSLRFLMATVVRFEIAKGSTKPSE